MLRESGYSLMEVIVSLTILTLAGSGLFLLSSTSISGTTRGKSLAEATALAAARIEELKNTPYADVAAGSDGAYLDADGAPGGIYWRFWHVTETQFDGVPAKDVAVMVQWGSASVSLSTLIVDTPNTTVPGSHTDAQSWNQVR